MFEKKPGLVRPEDFRIWDELEVIYEGKLNEYRDYLEENCPVDNQSKKYIEQQGIFKDKWNVNKTDDVIEDEIDNKAFFENNCLNELTICTK